MAGRALKSLLFLGAAYMVCNYFWLDAYFGPVKADQIIFHLQVPMQAASNSFFPSYLGHCLILPAALTVLYALMLGRRRPGRAYKIISSWGLVLALFFGAVYGQMRLDMHRPLAHLLGLDEDWSPPPELARAAVVQHHHQRPLPNAARPEPAHEPFGDVAPDPGGPDSGPRKAGWRAFGKIRLPSGPT